MAVEDLLGMAQVQVVTDMAPLLETVVAPKENPRVARVALEAKAKVERAPAAAQKEKVANPDHRRVTQKEREANPVIVTLKERVPLHHQVNMEEVDTTMEVAAIPSEEVATEVILAAATTTAALVQVAVDMTEAQESQGLHLDLMMVEVAMAVPVDSVDQALHLDLTMVEVDMTEAQESQGLHLDLMIVAMAVPVNSVAQRARKDMLAHHLLEGVNPRASQVDPKARARAESHQALAVLRERLESHHQDLAVLRERVENHPALATLRERVESHHPVLVDPLVQDTDEVMAADLPTDIEAAVAPTADLYIGRGFNYFVTSYVRVSTRIGSLWRQKWPVIRLV